jgi:hypothetical protein
MRLFIQGMIWRGIIVKKFVAILLLSTVAPTTVMAAPHTWQEIVVPVLTLTVFAALLLSYFVPIIVAFWRRHPSKWKILALTLFLGWSLLGWIVAMIWACDQIEDDKQKQKVGHAAWPD